MSNNKTGAALCAETLLRSPSDNQAPFRSLPIFSEKVGWRGRSCAMQSRFFLPGIAPDAARILHAFAARFLEPLVQFILVLIEPIAAKDIAPRKRGWGRFPAMLEDDSVGQVDDGIPIPGGGEGIGRVKHPCWAR